MVVIAVLAGLGWWVAKGMFNLPGVTVPDQGRDHLTREELEKVTYNSNPPTSGSHDPDWIRPGVYDTPQDKYKLIHSLEHGYVVVHYNCTKVTSNQYSVISASAHEDEGDLDGDSTPSAVFKADCSLAQVLVDWDKKIGLKRIIVNPNPELDKPVVLVAWGRILQMDKWNETEAVKFAKAYHNKGPEQTME